MVEQLEEIKAITENQNNNVYWDKEITINPLGEITPNWTISNNMLHRVNAISEIGLIFHLLKKFTPLIFVLFNPSKRYIVLLFFGTRVLIILDMYA